MCRRYVSPDEATIEREFDLVPSEWQFPANFNAAPSQAVPVIRVVEGQPDPVILNWGFGEYGTFNVSMETLDLAAGDRSLLAHGQRCIIPALGFYEWHAKRGGAKRPFYIHVEDQAVFGFAGLWERDSCTIITVPGNAMMAALESGSGRMPAILAHDQRDVWLYGSAANAAAALGAYPAEKMVAYAVTARVDSLSNNDETLIEPLETDVD
jgi:putative SOS response-associated peptidase YedK